MNGQNPSPFQHQFPPPPPQVQRFGLPEMIQIRMALQDFKGLATELKEGIKSLDKIIAHMLTGLSPVTEGTKQ